MVTHQTNSLRQNIAKLIQQQKGIRASRILTQTFEQLNFDLVDLYEIILAVEHKFQVIIPDEVPLNSVDDFVAYINGKGASAPLVVK